VVGDRGGARPLPGARAPRIGHAVDPEADTAHGTRDRVKPVKRQTVPPRWPSAIEESTVLGGVQGCPRSARRSAALDTACAPCRLLASSHGGVESPRLTTPESNPAGRRCPRAADGARRPLRRRESHLEGNSLTHNAEYGRS
jgi:hypothetical protein